MNDQGLPISAQTTGQNNRSERGDFLISTPSHLHLKDGSRFSGLAPAWQEGAYAGEVVFNTGMTGYVESLTDPSYANQILVFTYPLIGNYGVQLKDMESAQIQVSGLVVGELAAYGSHADSWGPLLEWLRAQNIPLLAGVDTRALTLHLRTQGTMLGGIGGQASDLKKLKLPPVTVTPSRTSTLNPDGKRKVVLVDCGTKDNIIKSLIALNMTVKRVPPDYDYTDEDYDGIVLSNGPGDPTDYQATIEITRRALKKDKPIFGICLGSQIMALAAGAKTYKLPYGHRGHNQPCMELPNEHCVITSQNHGYAIKEKSLPKDWSVWFRNLNDRSIEGIKHHTKPFAAVQFHPEASPGPTDTAGLFERFMRTL